MNTGTTPKVQYSYSEMVSGANHSRPTNMIYPNGRQLNYNYTAAIDAAISRLTSMSDTSATLEGFDYLGLATVVRRSHSQPGVDLTYIKQGVEGNGDAGDQYTGLDRFGRVVDQRWIKISDSSHTDRFKYGYDRDSNRLYRENLVDAAFSELYHTNGASNGYDNLNQLTEFRRGTLSDTNADNIPDTVSTATRYQVWTMDGQGNWSSLTTDGTSVSRTHDKQNEVTAVGAATLTFDANGNLKTDQNGQQYVYDAWNRLVTVKNSGASTIASYNYDALSHRIQQTVSATTTDFYFSSGWQVLEERVGGTAKVQYVWSPVYVDALVERDRDADGNPVNGLEERFYVQQDANFNVTAIISATGVVTERYVYDPYGAPTFLSAGWIGPADGYGWRILHQGGKFEMVTGLSNFGYRDTHVTLGRWIQVDPLKFGAGDTNLYRIEGNNSPNLVDPSGMDPPNDRDPIVRPPGLISPGFLGPFSDNPGYRRRYYSLNDWYRFNRAAGRDPYGLPSPVEIFFGQLQSIPASHREIPVIFVDFSTRELPLMILMGPMMAEGRAAAYLETWASEGMAYRASAWGRVRFPQAGAQVPATQAGTRFGPPQGCIGVERQLTYRGPILGGRYSDVRASNIGGDVHHLIADSVSPLPTTEGPAIWMPTLEHARTASFGNTRAARAFRAQQEQLIQQGRYSEVMRLGIEDVRTQFGSRHDQSLRQMLDYFRESGARPDLINFDF